MAKDRSIELSGLNKIKWAALIQLLLLLFVFVLAISVGIFSAGSSAGAIVIIIIVPVLVAAIASIWLIAGALRLLSSREKRLQKAHTAVIIGGILLVIGLLGTAVAVMAPYILGLVITSSSQYAQYAPTLCNGSFTAATNTQNTVVATICSTFNTIKNVIFIFALLFLILGGLIYAIAALWGLWIIGSIYNSDAIKAGAVLTTIISIPIVGPAILYIGVNDAMKKLASSK